MYETVGNCPKCGAPIYVQSPYWSVLPPPNIFSCNCNPRNTVTNYGHTVAEIENFKKQMNEDHKFWKDEPSQI